MRLNYHHLLYFWRVAREGGLAPAGKILHLSPQTLSGQLRSFEEALGQRLFDRRGRRLVLTDLGRVAYDYADQIFSLGHELSDVLERGGDRPRRLDVGLVEALPKMIARRVLEPIAQGEPQVLLSCREGTLGDLAARLPQHGLDVILADEPLPPGAPVRAFNHLLGETGVTFFASINLEIPRRRFPEVLDGTPMLVPLPGSPLRRQLDAFFARRGVAPRVVGEIEDSALLKAFGRTGRCVFCAPSVVDREITEMYGVRSIGSTDEIVERFYAISIERRVKHPAVAAILATSRERIFG